MKYNHPVLIILPAIVVLIGLPYNMATLCFMMMGLLEWSAGPLVMLAILAVVAVLADRLEDKLS